MPYAPKVKDKEKKKTSNRYLGLMIKKKIAARSIQNSDILVIILINSQMNCCSCVESCIPEFQSPNFSFF